MVSGGTSHVPSSLKYFVVPAVEPGAGTRPAAAVEPEPTNTSYVVLGGTCHVASSLKYLLVPAVVPGEGTRPEAAEEPDLTKLEYV